ncbi:carbonic anhydrase [bacterium]|nr:carbonic anhydrase [bacterium]
MHAADALAELRAGNQRFVTDAVDRKVAADLEHCRTLVTGQTPLAAVLGCADSRVPVEVVFDQGPGDLFVVRVAGNVAAPTQIGSLEYAVQVLGVRLVVVLGHSDCGAVTAALDVLGGAPSLSPHLETIVTRIRPSLPDAATAAADHDAALRTAVHANVKATVATVVSESDVLRPLVDAGQVLVAGAHYDLTTGRVDWLDA